jgi:hypothetical protein
MSTRPMQVVRFWWTFADPVSRRDYLRHEAGLVAIKYAGDALLVALAAGESGPRPTTSIRSRFCSRPDWSTRRLG